MLSEGIGRGQETSTQKLKMCLWNETVNFFTKSSGIWKTKTTDMESMTNSVL